MPVLSKTKKGPTGFTNQTYESPTDPDIIPATSPNMTSPTMTSHDQIPQYEDIDLVTGERLEQGDYYNLHTSLHQSDTPSPSRDSNLRSPDYDVIADGGGDSVRTAHYYSIPGNGTLGTYPNYETLPDGSLKFPNYETIPDSVPGHQPTKEGSPPDSSSSSSSSSSSFSHVVGTSSETPNYAKLDKTPSSQDIVTVVEEDGEGVYDELREGGVEDPEDTELVDNVIYK